MKYYYIKIFMLFIFLAFIICSSNVYADLPLLGKVIILDAGHGSEDPGTTYGKIYEKDINLKISLYLEKALSKYGASVIMIRDGDYDLSTPNTNHRKKSDFDNRIKLINESKGDMYISIHLNYLSNSAYKGAQVFYNNDNKNLAQVVQNHLNQELNGNREIKKIPTSTYMYNKLKIKGVLIECGFLSNASERNLLQSDEYQEKVAVSIADAIVKYYS